MTDLHAARDNTIPSLPWPSDAPPFTTVLDTKRGSAYDDAVASRYHFPSRYLAAIQGATGDWAAFNGPRDGGEGIAYFGVGRIANIVPDDAHSGFSYALIKDYLSFGTSAPW